jgi:hypothetical protein
MQQKRWQMTQQPSIEMTKPNGEFMKNKSDLTPESLAKAWGIEAIRITVDGGHIEVSGSIDLGRLTSLPESASLTVGGNLYLYNLTSLPESASLTVGGGLNLRGLTSLPESASLTVGGGLNLYNLTSLPESASLTVGGYLYLDSLTSLPESASLTVGGNLYLDSLTSLPENASLTVGGNLYLDSLTTLPENASLTVGGGIYPIRLNTPKRLNQQSDVEAIFNARGFTIADGILAKIISKRGNIKRVMIVGKQIVSYLISDGNGKHAHGETIKQARESLAFKTARRDVDQYRGMKLTTKKTPAEWAFVYRVITGACQSGTQHFIEMKGKLKAKYTLAEIIEQTRGAFGSERFREVVGA